MNNKTQDQVPDLSGKVVSINMVDDDCNTDLVDPRFEIQAGRMFIVGTTPDGASHSNWAAGCTCAVAWDRVTDYLVFDSVEHYTSATRKSAEGDQGAAQA